MVKQCKLCWQFGEQSYNEPIAEKVNNADCYIRVDTTSQLPHALFASSLTHSLIRHGLLEWNNMSHTHSVNDEMPV